MRAWPRIAALAAPRTLMMRAPSRPRPRLCPVPPASGPAVVNRYWQRRVCSVQRRVSDVPRAVACMSLCLMVPHVPLALACMYHL
jgi:hypothetical protein